MSFEKGEIVKMTVHYGSKEKPDADYLLRLEGPDDYKDFEDNGTVTIIKTTLEEKEKYYMETDKHPDKFLVKIKE